MVEYYRNKDFVDENISVDCQLISEENVTFVVNKISEGWVVIASNQQQNVRMMS